MVNISHCVCTLITQLSTFFVVCTSSLLSNAKRTHFVRVGELARDWLITYSIYAESVFESNVMFTTEAERWVCIFLTSFYIGFVRFSTARRVTIEKSLCVCRLLFVSSQQLGGFGAYSEFWAPKHPTSVPPGSLPVSVRRPLVRRDLTIITFGQEEAPKLGDHHPNSGSLLYTPR